MIRHKILTFLKSRSVKKSLTWRVIAIILTMCTAYAVTGSLEIAGSIGFIDTIVKTFVFWLHEEAWELVDKKSKD